MEKKYQVFVSSTFQDLQEERQHVIQALLELDCIPAGMELFPAANEDQWTLIKEVIDDCDYYIVISAGKYGSLAPDGMGYTEKEYHYAVEQGKPIIGFLYRDHDSLPVRKSEKQQNRRKKLEDFRILIQQRMCKYWTTPHELGLVVSNSLVKLIKKHPGTGWVRADQLPSENTEKEIVRLRRRIEELENELDFSSINPPIGTEKLQQGDDEFTLHFKIEANPTASWTRKREDDKFFDTDLTCTWNEIFAHVAPKLVDECNQDAMARNLERFAQQKLEKEIDDLLSGLKIVFARLNPIDFDAVLVQLRALGLIELSIRKRYVRDSKTYWTLTKYGGHVMTSVRALKRA